MSRPGKRSAAVAVTLGVLVCAVGACGDPGYDPYSDPWIGMDPWDPCSLDPFGCAGPGGGFDPSGTGPDPSGGFDPSGGYAPSGDPFDPGTFDPGSDPGTMLVGATQACSGTDVSCPSRTAAARVRRSMGAAVRWAREVRSSPASGGGNDAEVHGPVAVKPWLDAAPVVMRLAIASPAGGPVTWTLESKPPSAGDDEYQVVFRGSTVVQDARRRTGEFEIDLAAPVAAPAAAAVTGRVSGTFVREEGLATAEVVLSQPPDQGRLLRVRVEASPRGVQSQLVAATAR